MELSLIKVPGQGESIKSIEVNDIVFGHEFKPALIHQIVEAYKAGARLGSKAQKSRSEVRGGGIKPWKQKGTGRARAGTNRSPIWRKGGVTFAAKPRNYEQKVNKKMYNGAMRSILSELLRQERLIVVDNFDIASCKTRELLVKLKEMNLKEVMVVTDKIDGNLYLAARNLYDVDVRDVLGVDPVSLIGFDKVMFTAAALKQIEGRLQ